MAFAFAALVLDFNPHSPAGAEALTEVSDYLSLVSNDAPC